MKRKVNVSSLREEITSLADGLKIRFKDDFIALALFGSIARGKGGEESDLDVFCIIDNLPRKVYERKKLLSRIIAKHVQRRFSVIAKTRSEFLNHFSSLYLDLGLDAKVIYDRDDFLKSKLRRVREILKETGLKREQEGGNFLWSWEKSPKTGWEIDWEGYRELAKGRRV